MVQNILTIDVEEWYHRNYYELTDSEINGFPPQVFADSLYLLEILKEFNVKATFFILGEVAEKCPELVSRIKRDGHELAAHGYSHDLVYKQTKEQFSRSLKKSIRIIEEMTGESVLGYRAPSWSITRESYWALDLLEENGLIYDSSIYPMDIGLYGIKNSPCHPHFIGNICEVPPSTIRIAKRNIPFAGGFFFRLTPYFLIKWAIKRINQNGKPTVIYLHPWEVAGNIAKKDSVLKERIISSANLKKTEGKLRKLLSDFEFDTIKNMLERYHGKF